MKQIYGVWGQAGGSPQRMAATGNGQEGASVGLWLLLSFGLGTGYMAVFILRRLIQKHT